MPNGRGPSRQPPGASSAPGEAQNGKEPEHHEDCRRPDQRQSDV